MNIDTYRELLEYEIDCNAKMLAMIESVPIDRRNDPRFQQALNLAAHIAACRENWLKWMARSDDSVVAWFEESAELDSLRGRFSAIEQKWAQFLAAMDGESIKADFTFADGDPDTLYRWTIEGQTLQLFLHTPYHRGQIVLLVDQLGGETVDTDYVNWSYQQDPKQFEM